MSNPAPLVHALHPVEMKSIAEHSMPRPILAVLFHGRDEELTMVTVHQVNAEYGKAPVIKSGKILTPQDEAEMARLLLKPEESVNEVQIFPENLLHLSRHSVAWHVAGRRRPMLLRNSEGQLQVLDVIWPNLVFHSAYGELRVATYTGDRPKAADLLFHAPLANVFADTRVCLGSASIPATSRLEDIPAFEAAMFESAFTHQNHQEAIRPSGKKGSAMSSSDPMQVWPYLDGGLLSFPERNLNPLGMTLAGWLGSAQ